MTPLTFPHDVVDLFAGPGGWSVACRRLGLREIGIETDKAAHLTRRAAGFHTIRASVTDLGPNSFPRARGLIASPPCQTFSAAGKGSGRKALDTVLAAVEGMARGVRYPATEWEDARTWLVLEPLRWHLAALDLGRPYRWIALEQVPTVLPVWEAYADVLRAEGYSVAVSNLHAEQYGVPQTRKRAILMASLDREMALPAPTHSRYHTRSPKRLDLGVLPWVSMAEALGWTDGPDLAHWRGAGMLERHGDRPSRSANEPAFTMAGGGTGSGGLRWLVHGERHWATTRPSTTIVGSFKPEIVAAPGYRVSAADGSHQNAPGYVRVTVEEAACLQSFPAGFPWQGSKTKRYQQVGNAIPPLLAEAVLRQVHADRG